eukprot:37372-Prorocentrum_lima.AAC.1
MLGVSDRTVGPSLPQGAGAGCYGAYCIVFFGFMFGYVYVATTQPLVQIISTPYLLLKSIA